MCYLVWGQHGSHFWSLWSPERMKKNVRALWYVKKKHRNPPNLLVGATLHPSLGGVLRPTVPPTPKHQWITCMFREGPKNILVLVLNLWMLWLNNNLPAGGEKRRGESFCCWDVAVNWATYCLYVLLATQLINSPMSILFGCIICVLKIINGRQLFEIV